MKGESQDMGIFEEVKADDAAAEIPLMDLTEE